MRIIHRVGLRATNAQRHELESLGVKTPEGIALPGGGEPLVAFDVGEDHPNWSSLLGLIGKWEASDLVRTEFSRSEIEAAAWLKLDAEWHHGYPQPRELDFSYREATYDLTNYCERCGIGMKQKAPFQIRSEPKWGKRSILQLNWVFDEFLVTPEAWASVFEPHGIECRPVLNTKRAELTTILQMVAREEVGIIPDDLSKEEAACSTCGRTKYLPWTRGPFPALAVDPPASIVKTKEYFGSGASAHRAVLIPQVVARAMLSNDMRGASLRPVAERTRR